MNPSYHRPDTVEAAIALKAELGEGAFFLAGGTEVNNRLANRPTALIDLAGLGLDGIEPSASGVTIGARVTFQQLLESAAIPDYLKRAARQMANRNIRNRATLGGQLGLNRSCADLIPTLLAADATVVTATGERALEDYLAGPSDLILSVALPATTRGFGAEHMTRTASDVSIVATAASAALANGALEAPILAIGGVAKHVVRLHDVEAAIAGKPLPSTEELEALIAAAVSPIDDLRGSAGYKQHIAAVLGARALLTATEGGR